MAGESFSHYRILSKLGQGGMGEVFLALDTQLDRKVALKFITGELSKDPVAQKRLMREARAIAALDYPFICKVYEAAHDGGQDFIAMEYVEGRTLKDMLAEGPLPEADVLRIAREIAEALEVSHEHGIVHRDLKPANIMIGRGGHVKVMDFGLAKEPLAAAGTEGATGTALSASWAIVGTLDYMAPEQLKANQADARSDIFAFGLVLCELLTGKNPLSRPTPAETVAAIMSETPAPLPTELRLAPVLRRMLEKDPRLRYQSVKAVLADLNSADLSAGEALTVCGPVSGHLEPSAAGAAAGMLHKKHRLRLSRKAAAGVMACSVAVAAWLIWYLIYPGSTVLGFQERDWIVLIDFDNQTGETIFDKSLDTAFRVSLEQSAFVNILPKSRVEQALQRMKKKAGLKVDEALASEIAQREGIHILLAPSIAGIGGTYVLSTTLADAVSRAPLTAQSVRVRGKENVLAAVDRLTRDTRHRLGESRSAISQRGKDLAKATTASLEALQQFSFGIEAHKTTKFVQARTFYENAISLDPNFASAVASLGMLHFERFDPGEGKRLLQKAISMVDNLTDPEKYSILAFYARAVENDIPKAVRQWKVLSGMYPDNADTRNNLGWFYSQSGNYAASIAEYREALRINPYLMLSYGGLAIVYLYHTGEASAAVDLCLKQVAVDDRGIWGYDNLGWGYLGIGDLKGAQTAFENALRVNNDPKLFMRGFGNPYQIDLYRLAHTLRLLGKYAECLTTLDKIRQLFPGSAVEYERGNVAGLMHDRQKAQAFFQECRLTLEQKEIPAAPKDANNHMLLALAYQRLGRAQEAQSSFRKAVALAPEQHFEFARFHCVAGKPDEALQELHLAVQKGFRNIIWMKIHPDLQDLYTDARFQALVKQYLR